MPRGISPLLILFIPLLSVCLSVAARAPPVASLSPHITVFFNVISGRPSVRPSVESTFGSAARLPLSLSVAFVSKRNFGSKRASPDVRVGTTRKHKAIEISVIFVDKRTETPRESRSNARSLSVVVWLRTREARDHPNMMSVIFSHF